jgi:hypothetical protein
MSSHSAWVSLKRSPKNNLWRIRNPPTAAQLSPIALPHEKDLRSAQKQLLSSIATGAAA